MKINKILLVWLLFFVTTKLLAQCPIRVSITKNLLGSNCQGTIVTYKATPSAGALGVQYVWVIGADTVGTLDSLNTETLSSITVYITSSNCTNTASFNVKPDIIYYEMQTETVESECNQVVADLIINNVSSYGGSPPYTYQLVSGNKLVSQRTLYEDLAIGSHLFLVTDMNNCTDSVWVEVTQKGCDPIKPNEYLTPNGDGYNDLWNIGNIDKYEDNDVYIFDRWGQRVYHQKNYTNIDGWDAKYLGNVLPATAFYYIIKLHFDKSDDVVIKGAVSILR